MSETQSEPATGPVVTAAPVYATESPHAHKPSRLNQVAAWVGIVAGIVFIVAVVFGTGFMLGAHTGKGSGGGHGRGGPPPAMMQQHGPMFPGGTRPGPGFVFPGGPGMFPGEPGGPGGQGAERPGPPSPPTSGATPPR